MLRHPEENDMTTTLTTPAASVSVRPTVRRTGPSLPTLAALEARKSLTTRSGKSLAVAAVVLAPTAAAIASAASNESLASPVGPLAVMGMLTGFIVMAIGVLSTAGEWTHKSVQTTFLLVPSRSRVLAAKAVAMATLGAAFTAVAVGLSASVLAVTQDGMVWDGTGRALLAVVGFGAAFAVTGAGVGAALANSPASLTGLYLVILGVIPAVNQFKPEVGMKIDPSNAVINLAQGAHTTQSIAIIAGWAVVSLAAGAILTSRRAVQ
jgi:ABC-2 type transport system permease protein